MEIVAAKKWNELVSDIRNTADNSSSETQGQLVGTELVGTIQCSW